MTTDLVWDLVIVAAGLLGFLTATCGLAYVSKNIARKDTNA